MVEKENENTATKRKHTRTHTWTTVSDAKAVLNKVKQRNYNDYTESNIFVAIHYKLNLPQ